MPYITSQPHAHQHSPAAAAAGGQSSSPYQQHAFLAGGTPVLATAAAAAPGNTVAVSMPAHLVSASVASPAGTQPANKPSMPLQQQQHQQHQLLAQGVGQVQPVSGTAAAARAGGTPMSQAPVAGTATR
jgi:hypothetical protein